MTRLVELQGQIASMGELLDIVGAMRSLAGMRAQEAQHALPGVSRYADSMAAAVGAALMLLPERAHRAFILCASEHGFVGGFNERLLEAAEAVLKPDDLLFMLGSRGAALAVERGRKVVWARPMATHLTGVADAVDHLAGELYARIVRGEVSSVAVMFGRSAQRAGAATIAQRLLLPLDVKALSAAQPRQPPLHNLAPRPLVEKLMAEYVFALLTEAAVESIASENAARFAAMDSAHDNVTKKLSQLRQTARQERQSEITSELLDLITGAEAIVKPQRERHGRMRLETANTENFGRPPRGDVVLRRTP